MGQGVTPRRAVFDTNVVVSALLFGQGRVSWLRTSFRSGSVVPIVSRATVQELVRVLEYPKLALNSRLPAYPHRPQDPGGLVLHLPPGGTRRPGAQNARRSRGLEDLLAAAGGPPGGQARESAI